MPLPGGPADKLGNRYELWWTVRQLVRMLDGSADHIRIEDPGLVKAEFSISFNGCSEFHQAKRSHSDGKWSISTLVDIGMLQAIKDQLTGNHAKFVFISSSDARELAELTERSRQAESAQEFDDKFLEAKEVRGHFDKLQKVWCADLDCAFGILRRVEVRVMDERSIEDTVNWSLRALFLSDPGVLCKELRTFAEDSLHTTITRSDLVNRLMAQGHKLRQLRNPEAARALAQEVTEKYCAGVRKSFIRKTLIHRPATQSLLTLIDADGRGGDFVLTGTAGSGKSGCIVEVIETLQTRGVLVLAFRLDRLSPVLSTHEIGNQLGLEESPTLVLAAAAHGEAVLVVDQLDAVSTTSGRNADFFDTVEELIEEARGLRARLRLHVVVVCRAVDWENDHRLRRLLSRNHEAPVHVAELSQEDVRAALSAEKFTVELFQPQQLELLRLPQNLSQFLGSGFDPASEPTFNTTKELFDRYWDAKRLALTARTPSDQWVEVIETLCDEMNRTQRLWAAREKLDRYEPFAKQMASEGVLTLTEGRFGFGHESFFDYCFARMFVARDLSIVSFLASDEQHLFRRAQVRQILAYLRDSDPARYCMEVHSLLTDSRVRLHIKDLTLALIANCTQPSEDEWQLLEPFLSAAWATIDRAEKVNDFAFLVWSHVFSSRSWFRLLDDLSLIAGWLAAAKPSLANMAVNYLRFHQRHAGDRVAELLEPYVGRGDEWNQRLSSLIQWADFLQSRRFFDLFLRLIDDGTLDGTRGPIAINSTFWSMFYGMAEKRPEWIPEVAAHWLMRRSIVLQLEKTAGQETRWDTLFNGDHTNELLTAAKACPDVFVQHVMPVVINISDTALARVDLTRLYDTL